ncbi:MAG: hypothetical protein A3A73_04795 [Omnitrophica bacterium RIFCSPLOWO2_01_FULL_50_24]|nr:MAG: hypothetical protein A3A73_04795 [Omnitrophica bacterium RIFCSPLOWO2_01_FULL_50_24]
MVPATNFRSIFQIGKRKSKHAVKVTALLYLKEALLKERYEECPLMITIAKEFGAQDFEIRNLLEDRRRSPV